MVFSSVPAYLDPNNWQQQHNHQQGSSSENPQLPQPMPPPGAGVAGAIRPNSMAERARLAKVPPPEPALKCPRCNSTNTKFCYFNNYSLTQPRHFCKTCRRYWTRGGALRNVPVGGGCRRNKKSKGGSSKSPASSDQQTSGGSTGAVSSSSFAAEVISRIPPLLPSQLPFMSSLGYGTSDMGLNYSGIQMAGGGSEMEFQIGSNQTSFGSVLSSGIEQWRLQQQLQQSPYLSGLEPPSGLYPLEGERVETSFGIGGAGLIRSRLQSSSGPNQQASVKSEGNQGLNSSRQFLGIQGNDQYLDGNTWTDLSNFTSSSNTHLL
ncbi:hypothetical protein AAC387_Pa09g1669 [Persea americana]